MLGIPSGWLNFFGAALSGGAVVKIFDYFYSEYRRKSEESRAVRKLVGRHLDPILKAADELVGKIASLAKEDFRELRHKASPAENSLKDQIILTNILFLVAQFWARIQLLRLESLYADLARENKGRRITAFLAALEANRNRLVDRAWQRGIGESLITHRGDKIELLTYHDFVELYLSDTKFRAWFEPVASLLQQIRHTRYRQRILMYGSILHSFIDTLDPKHLIVRTIPAWPNKLSRRSRRELEYRVFRVYLPFVSEWRKYCHTSAKPKKRRP
jgi:hypothetical protein